ncbi:hypothetical protein AAFF_G00192900, partial [Aldrovandia affinis]
RLLRRGLRRIHWFCVFRQPSQRRRHQPLHSGPRRMRSPPRSLQLRRWPDFPSPRWPHPPAPL